MGCRVKRISQRNASNLSCNRNVTCICWENLNDGNAFFIVLRFAAKRQILSSKCFPMGYNTHHAPLATGLVISSRALDVECQGSRVRVPLGSIIVLTFLLHC